MTPKNKLFIGILIFGLIVNLLIIFDLNYFYIRAILGFIFIITIPGLLIMLCLKIRNINFWEYLVYTIGLSVAFIMFAGLAVNWILPFLNITDKPLSLYPILISFDTILLILWIIAQRRNEDNAHILIFPFEEYERKPYSRFKFIPKFPSLSWLDRIFIIIPFFFPFMAVIGAFLLNNHGTNIITMIMLGAIAVYVFLVVLFRDKLNENVFPWALYWIGLALLLSFSMRGQYVTGGDIVKEYKIFQITFQNNFWSVLSSTENAYNSCLSLTILPTIFYYFIKVDSLFIFKLFIQIISPLATLIVFLISKRYINNILSFFSGFFFMSFNGFLISFPMHIRQEIAFLFFGIVFLVLFSKEINPKIKNLLFVIFGFSMIVSHYSTAYVALTLFVLSYICIFIYKKLENRKIKEGKIKEYEREEFYLTLGIVLLLLVFGFLWLSQLTHTSQGLETVLSESFSNLKNSLVGESSIELESTYQILNEFIASSEREYLEELENKDYTSYKTYLISPSGSQGVIDLPTKIHSAIRIVNKNINNLFKGLTVLGFILFLILLKKESNKNYLLFSFVFLIFLVFMKFIPFTGANYDPLRFHYQSLFLLALPTVLCLPLLFKSILKEKICLLLSIVLFILYFLFSSGFIMDVVGGGNPTIQLTNEGLDNLRWINNPHEVPSSTWLSKNENGKDELIITSYDFIKFPFIDYPFRGRIVLGVFPQTVIKNSYVYLDYSNKISGTGFIYTGKTDIAYNFPIKFLNDNKNKIYNNGGSEIFK